VKQQNRVQLECQATESERHNLSDKKQKNNEKICRKPKCNPMSFYAYILLLL